MNNSQRTAIIILSVFLFTVIILTQDNDHASDQEEISTSEENIVNIAVTYEKLAENVELWPHPVSEEKIIDLVNFTEAEINQYCKENQIDTKFKFIPTPVIHKGGTQAGENPPGLDEMIQLNEAGINLIVGHDYSMANRYSLGYANEQKMLLLSPVGVGLGQSIPDDNLYKLAPNMYEDPAVYDRVYAQMIKELGYQAFITINTGKRCIFRNLLDETAQAISYSYEGSQVEFDVNADDFTPYLDRAAENLQTAIELYGVEHVCVLTGQLGVDELIPFLDLMDNRSVFETVTWYDFSGIPEEIVFEEGLAPRLAKYGFVQIILSPSMSDKAKEFLSFYEEKVGDLPTPARIYGEAARYDAMWIMAQAVIEANSSSTDDIKKVLPQICLEYLGVIGNCTLNNYGDRISADYDLYRWITIGKNARFVNIGHYDSETSKLRMNDVDVESLNVIRGLYGVTYV